MRSKERLSRLVTADLRHRQRGMGGDASHIGTRWFQKGNSMFKGLDSKMGNHICLGFICLLDMNYLALTLLAGAV